MTSKEQLRREIAEKRRLLDPEWITEASLRVVGQLQRLDAFNDARSIALYKAIAGEVDLETLFSACWDLGKRTAIPVFNAALNAYELAHIEPETRYITGHYGIREPANPSMRPQEPVDLIIVPGVAFDTKGNRLGRGGGYYDRILAGFLGIKAAAAFEFQLFPDIPHEAGDIPVDCIVTESKVFNVFNEH
jgi:5-formyltetrahydrofolate cyclo-ligase